MFGKKAKHVLEGKKQRGKTRAQSIKLLVLYSLPPSSFLPLPPSLSLPLPFPLSTSFLPPSPPSLPPPSPPPSLLPSLPPSLSLFCFFSAGKQKPIKMNSVTKSTSSHSHSTHHPLGLHPSWEAQKRKKAMEAGIPKFQGQRTVFFDSD